MEQKKKMPPQNAVEMTPTKSSSETPKNGNLNNNDDKDNALTKFDIQKTEENEPTKATIVIPPDGGFGWVVMMASFCCNLIVDGIVFSFGSFIEPIQNDLGASKASIALVGSLLSGFYLIFGPFVSGELYILNFTIVYFIIFTTATTTSPDKSLWLPSCHHLWSLNIIVCIRACFFCTKSDLSSRCLRNFWRNRILFYLHALSHHCWLLF